MLGAGCNAEDCSLPSAPTWECLHASRKNSQQNSNRKVGHQPAPAGPALFFRSASGDGRRASACPRGSQRCGKISVMDIVGRIVLTAPSSGAQTRERHPRAVAAWLLACCALLFAMVVVGGVTRLTHSGLSITEWQPIIGTLPPLTDVQWAETFAKYQATPEYSQVNRGMTLDAFKSIFWWEYCHRLLGRAIGVAFVLPLLGFIARRRIPAGLAPKLVGIFALGALQGAMGWYMVQSGLVDDPRVSQLRLTAHLGLAFIIFAAMLWTALSLLRGPARGGSGAAPLRRCAYALTALVFVMVLSGGLVAGIRAGFAYNTFPLMNGYWVPPEIMSIDPWYRNFYNNMATVQFDHW